MNRVLKRFVIISGLLVLGTPCITAEDTQNNAMSKWPKIKVTERSDNMVPRWVSSELPKRKSYGYDIVRCSAQGQTAETALAKTKRDLVNQLATEHGIEVDDNLTDIETNLNDRIINNHEVFVQKVGDKANGVFNCQSIDYYYERRGNTYYAVELIAVTGPGNQIPDKFKTTTSYGAAPVFYSLIPGVGQMYKGSTVKGGIILGSAVVVGAGIITAESLRASYIKKMKEYPKHHDFYNNKATTCKNIRNVTIGVGAGLYLYNLIDAAVAQGRKRVIVSKKNRYDYSLAPVWDGENVSLAFNLDF
ncbi:MAG: hypothetical protein K2L00_02600 [Muribaculaceae bacterium]|nr:hypothetical protein [Muribaculaceae bacterium]